MATSRFALGQTVATPGALEALSRAGATPLPYLVRHAAGDWGELDEDDKAENEFAVNDGYEFYRHIGFPDGTVIWVITEADRSATTILLPEEY